MESEKRGVAGLNSAWNEAFVIELREQLNNNTRYTSRFIIGGIGVISTITEARDGKNRRILYGYLAANYLIKVHEQCKVSRTRLARITLHLWTVYELKKINHNNGVFCALVMAI